MKHNTFSTHMKKGVQFSLILAILLFNFTVSGTRTVHAAPPSNDDITDATLIDELSYQDLVDLTEATQDPSDPDNVACGTSGTTELNHLNRGNNTVWYTYTPTVRELIAVNTIGSEYSPGVEMDTYVAVWKGTTDSLTFVKCNDDNFVGTTSELTFTAQAGVTYFIEVANYNCEFGISNCGQQLGGSLVFNATISNTHVTIAGQLKDSYYISTGQSVKDTYGKLNTGPVLLETGLVQPFVAAMAVNYKQAGKFVSYSQTMGFPADQATTEYVFPRYTNKSSQNSQLRIANVDDDTDTTVEVYIGGVLKGTPIPLAAGESTAVSYSGTDAGPVRVVSTDPNVNIVASMRVIYKYNGKNVSYSELMGYPKNQLHTVYLFPWYVNSANLKSQLRVANMGTEATNIQVYVDGVLEKTYPGLAAGASIPLSVSGRGTMRVVSTNPAVDILASLRQIYRRNSVPVSYSELMGYPEDQLTVKYAFPWYTNGSNMLTKFRIVNTGAEDTTVEVYIGGELKGSHFVEAGKSILSPGYSTLNIGPVRIDSTNSNVDILVSMQITYKQSGVPVSYSELTGYPYLVAQPTTSYLLPWYTNSSNVKSQLLFGYP